MPLFKSHTDNAIIVRYNFTSCVYHPPIFISYVMTVHWNRNDSCTMFPLTKVQYKMQKKKPCIIYQSTMFPEVIFYQWCQIVSLYCCAVIMLSWWKSSLQPHHCDPSNLIRLLTLSAKVFFRARIHTTFSQIKFLWTSKHSLTSSPMWGLQTNTST